MRLKIFKKSQDKEVTQHQILLIESQAGKMTVRGALINITLFTNEECLIFLIKLKAFLSIHFCTLIIQSDGLNYPQKCSTIQLLTTVLGVCQRRLLEKCNGRFN